MHGSEKKVFRFQQVDVFSAEPFKGNPLAVVVDADEWSDAEMAAFARWTNLSETTFLLQPTSNDADYRVRIFTPMSELPFAGHPTLGSCHVWLATGGKPKDGTIVQECAAGQVRLRASDGRLSFAAPPLRRSGPVDEPLLARVVRGLGIQRQDVLDANWVDNGPGWMALLLRDADQVLAIEPDFGVLSGIRVGVVAPIASGSDRDADVEVRAFTAAGFEDPVTGALNAGIAQWLIGSGRAGAAYVASQGTALGRAGRIHIEHLGGQVWVGGHVTTHVDGTVTR